MFDTYIVYIVRLNCYTIYIYMYVSYSLSLLSLCFTSNNNKIESAC